MYSNYPATVISPIIPFLALLVPIAVFGAAIGLFWWVRRRQFYRTNQAGVEEFKNFRSAVLSDLLEWLAMILRLLLFLPGLGSALWVFTLFIEARLI